MPSLVHSKVKFRATTFSRNVMNAGSGTSFIALTERKYISAGVRGDAAWSGEGAPATATVAHMTRTSASKPRTPILPVVKSLERRR